MDPTTAILAITGMFGSLFVGLVTVLKGMQTIQKNNEERMDKKDADFYAAMERTHKTYEASMQRQADSIEKLAQSVKVLVDTKETLCRFNATHQQPPGQRGRRV